MLAGLLPRRLDNDYAAPRTVLWLFGTAVLFKSFCAVNSTFNSHFVARVSEGIPVGNFPPAAEQTIAALLGMRGLAQLLACVLCVIALVRYRALIPLLFTLTLVEVLGRLLIVYRDPFATPGLHPAVVLHYAVLALCLIGLPLSLRGGRRGTGAPAEAREEVLTT